MSQIINDEEELNTATDPDLKTEYYDLEILGLKNVADLRKFSRSFMRIVKVIFGIESNKLDKGGYTGNAKNLNDEISKKASKSVLGRMIVGDNLTVDANGRVSGNPAYTHPTGAGNNHIPAGGNIGQVLKNSGNGVATWGDMDLENYYTKTETDEKFKNFCPFKVGDIYLTTNSTNPSSIFLGTTWQKIEGRFLLGTSGSGASKQTGGSNQKTIAQSNLPNVKLTVDSHTHTNTGHTHGIGTYVSTFDSGGTWKTIRLSDNGSISGGIQSLSAGGNTTGGSSPKTSALGSGQALDITPAYYTVHMWLRTS